MIELVVEGNPIVWRAPYIGSRGAFSPKFHQKQIIQQMLRSTYKGILLKLPVIVACDITFFLPIPKSVSKTKRELMLDNLLRPMGGGDLVNLRKFYEDCLQGIVIENDRQIVEGDTSKWYGEQPKTIISILPI